MRALVLRPRRGHECGHPQAVRGLKDAADRDLSIGGPPYPLT